MTYTVQFPNCYGFRESQSWEPVLPLLREIEEFATEGGRISGTERQVGRMATQAKANYRVETLSGTWVCNPPVLRLHRRRRLFVPASAPVPESRISPRNQELGHGISGECIAYRLKVAKIRFENFSQKLRVPICFFSPLLQNSKCLKMFLVW